MKRVLSIVAATVFAAAAAAKEFAGDARPGGEGGSTAQPDSVSPGVPIGSREYVKLARRVARMVGNIDRRFQREIARAEDAHDAAAAEAAAAERRRVLSRFKKAWKRAPALGPGNPTTCEELCRQDKICLNGCYVLGGL